MFNQGIELNNYLATTIMGWTIKMIEVDPSQQVLFNLDPLAYIYLDNEGNAKDWNTFNPSFDERAAFNVLWRVQDNYRFFLLSDEPNIFTCNLIHRESGKVYEHRSGSPCYSICMAIVNASKDSQPAP